MQAKNELCFCFVIRGCYRQELYFSNLNISDIICIFWYTEDVIMLSHRYVTMVNWNLRIY